MARPKTGFNKSSLKNLKQFQDLDEEEFEGIVSERQLADEYETFENEIKNKIAEFESDYDLSDMKINDLMTLRELAKSFIALDKIEFLLYLERQNTSLDNITIIEKLGRQANDLRGDISKLQNDLNITRKIRKGDREDSIQAYLDKLKDKAKEFYDQKMGYVFCPNCNMLLATTWFLYPDAENEITLECHRELDNGEECGTVVKVSSKILMNDGSNKPEIVPVNML